MSDSIIDPLAVLVSERTETEGRVAEAALEAISGIKDRGTVQVVLRDHLPGAGAAWRLWEGDVTAALMAAAGIRGLAEPIRQLASAIRREARRQTPTSEHGQPDGAEAAVLERLVTTKEGKVVASLRNAALVFEHDSRWCGRARWNELGLRVELDGHPITDADEIKAAIWLDEQYAIPLSSRVTHEALTAVASEHRYHPIRDYLRSVTWDGKERAPLWLHWFLGVEDSWLTRAQAVAYLIQAVARVECPGCQADATLILHGQQGAQKSTSLRVLFEPWHAECAIDLDDPRDAAQQLRGVWGVEFAELDSLRKSEVTACKAFLTRRDDHYRPSYGRNEIDAPRQCVFSGTTNAAAFLNDPTGSRRFWVVSVGQINIKALQEDRDQIWAEAFARYTRGERWFLDADLEQERASVAESFEIEDPRETKIADWLIGKTEITMPDLLTAIGAPVTRQGSAGISEILRGLGWHPGRRSDAARTRCWVRDL